MRKEREVAIGDKRGLHLRVIRAFAEKAQGYSSSIHVQSSTAAADGKSPLEMMLLEGGPGSKLKIVAEGEDAGEALAALAEFIENPDLAPAPGEENT